MTDVQKHKPKHGPGHLVGDYQESGKAQEPDEKACEKAPGGLVGNYQKSGQCEAADEAETSHDARADLGRPNPNEDKDMNLEQFKKRTKEHASAQDAQLARVSTPRQSAERVDPTGRTRAGEQH